MESQLRKTNVETDFEERAQEFYPEHVRRMRAARETAGRAKLTYALSGLFLPAAPLLGLGVLLGAVQTTLVDFVGRNLGPTQSSTVTPEHIALAANGLFVAAVVLGVLGFIIGFLMGIGRNHDLLFQAEKWEMEIHHALRNSGATLGRTSQALSPTAVSQATINSAVPPPVRPRMAPPPPKRSKDEIDPDF